MAILKIKQNGEWVEKFIKHDISISDLENYYLKSQTYTKEEVNALISGTISFIVVDTLPTASAETMGDIYLVPSSSSKVQNVKDEFITIESSGTYSWEQIGSTAIDLSQYYTKTETNALLDTKANSSDVYNKTEVNSLLGSKQNTLIAGENITIQDNVISASGGSNGADWSAVEGEDGFISNKPFDIPNIITRIELENTVVPAYFGNRYYLFDTEEFCIFTEEDIGSTLIFNFNGSSYETTITAETIDGFVYPMALHNCYFGGSDFVPNNWNYDVDPPYTPSDLLPTFGLISMEFEGMPTTYMGIWVPEDMGESITLTNVTIIKNDITKLSADKIKLGKSMKSDEGKLEAIPSWKNIQDKPFGKDFFQEYGSFPTYLEDITLTYDRKDDYKYIYKYTTSDIEYILSGTGMNFIAIHTDDQYYYGKPLGTFRGGSRNRNTTSKLYCYIDTAQIYIDSSTYFVITQEQVETASSESVVNTTIEFYSEDQIENIHVDKIYWTYLNQLGPNDILINPITLTTNKKSIGIDLNHLMTKIYSGTKTSPDCLIQLSGIPTRFLTIEHLEVLQSQFTFENNSYIATINLENLTQYDDNCVSFRKFIDYYDLECVEPYKEYIRKTLDLWNYNDNTMHKCVIDIYREDSYGHIIRIKIDNISNSSYVLNNGKFLADGLSTDFMYT